MPTVVGVRLRPSGQVYTFDTATTTPAEGDFVVVSTERGEEFGEVVDGQREATPQDMERKLKPILRIATQADREKAEDLREREAGAMQTYRRLVHEHGLDMKPVDVEFLFDGRKVVFYFVAEERVDFRDLVRDLANEFRSRIDMRQIGVRDEARMVGGLGHCGQQLCCVRFEGDFQPVSIRMAKAQDLPLNPLKISGLCGRLMCCLRYEYEAYKDFKSRAPKQGARIDTPRGEARVVSLDAPRETVTLGTEKGRLTVPLGSMECKGCESGRPCHISEDALSEAEASVQDKSLLAVGVGGPALDSGQKPRGKGGPDKGGRPAKGGGPRGGGAKGGGSKGGGAKDGGSKGDGSGRSRSGRRRKRGGRKRGQGGSQQGQGQSQGQKGQQQGHGQQGQQQKGQGQQGQQQKGQGQKGQQSGKGGGSSGSQGSSGRRRRRRRPSSGSGGGQPQGGGAPKSGQGQ
jgi:cell fate regulator YaaT (PSP1 superfamily)